MSDKVLVSSDLMIVRDTAVRGVFITSKEKRRVYELVGELGFYLYESYKTEPFKEANELTDGSVGEMIGWNARKVQRIRLALVKAGLVKIFVGTGLPKITHLIVGEDQVALHNAGLPCKIVNVKAFKNLKKELGIEDTSDLIANIPEIINRYNCDPERYK